MHGKIILLTTLVFIIALSGCTGTVPEQAADQACAGSGGNVTAASCCLSASDFPNTCLIGACGCSPGNSHDVKTCDCGEGKCFNGTACVAA